MEWWFAVYHGYWIQAVLVWSDRFGVNMVIGWLLDLGVSWSDRFSGRGLAVNHGYWIHEFPCGVTS